MKALQCEMCGSQDLVKDGGVFVCQSCGTKYTAEEAKKMMVEGTVDVKGTVKVDTSDELKNLYEIARRAKNSNNSDNAVKYYDMILVKDPNSWEANFYTTYYQVMNCKIAEIASAANKMANCEESVLQLIKKGVDDNEQSKIFQEIYVKLHHIANMLYSSAIQTHNERDASYKAKYEPEVYNRTMASINILYTYGSQLEKLFEGKFSLIAVKAWKDAISMHKDIVRYSKKISNDEKTIKSFSTLIQKYDQSYKAPFILTNKKQWKGCLIIILVILIISWILKLLGIS